jgi:hypothetical protein
MMLANQKRAVLCGGSTPTVGCCVFDSFAVCHPSGWLSGETKVEDFRSGEIRQDFTLALLQMNITSCRLSVVAHVAAMTQVPRSMK